MGVVLNCVEEPTVPNVVYLIPLLDVVIHRSVPFVLAAPLILPVGSLRAVDVSTVPAGVTRPTTRFVVAGVSRFGAVPPGALSYPPRTSDAPSTDLDRKPSELALPAAVRILFAPLAAVGMAIDWTNAPAGVYSSRKTAVATEVGDAVPSPTR